MSILAELDPEDLELAYQMFIYRDEDPGALLSDIKARYGTLDAYLRFKDTVAQLKNDESWKNILSSRRKELAALVMSRLKDRFRSALCILASRMGLGGKESVIRAQFSLAGFSDIVDELVKAGVLMHDSNTTLIVPEYLIQELIQIKDCPDDLDPSGILDTIKDHLTMAIIESVAFSSKPIPSLFKALYGVSYSEGARSISVEGLMSYVDGDLVLNPLIDHMRLRQLMHGLKDARARFMRRIISPHGQYVYSRRIRCGVVYTAFSGSSRVILLLCPWILPTRTLMEYHSGETRVLITTQPFRETILDYARTSIDWRLRDLGFVFLNTDEGNAIVIRPGKGDREFEASLDFLYRSNIRVLYAD